MTEKELSNDIDFRSIYLQLSKISRKLKKTFFLLFIIIMGISFLYFIKVTIKPSYESSTLLKTSIITKNQLENYAEYINESIGNEFENKFLPNNIVETLKTNNVVSIGFEQKRPDLSDPNKSELYSLFTLNVQYSKKPVPENLKNVNVILDYIRGDEAKQNNVVEGKKNVENSLKEVDSLISVAFNAGSEFKNKMNTGSGSMVVISDLYKSVNEILATKKALENELFKYQTENIIYQASPTILTKKIKFPMVVLFAGFIFWLFVCFSWLIVRFVFGETES